VDVDASLPPVALPGRIVNELQQHALETRPEECCGLILGGAAARFSRLVRCRNEMTRRHAESPREFPQDARQAFWMNETDVLEAQKLAEASGEDVTAVYHSHVGAGVYLSALDLGYAEHPLFPFPQADQIVIAVHEGPRAELGIFQREAIGRPFTGRTIVSAGP
jgi:proteasome lid subunit RPN8/RPN11